MSAAQFADLQEALLWTLLPVVHWLLVLLVAGGFLGAVLWIWLGFLRHLTRPK